jgi:hypothetical protein
MYHGGLYVCAILAGAIFAQADETCVVRDWRLQDGVDAGVTYRQAVAAIVQELGDAADEWQTRMRAAHTPAEWERLYLMACRARRERRLTTLVARAPRFIFTRHYDLGGSHYAYTEGQSDAQSERHFVPGASLCLWELSGLYGRVETLLEDAGGVIRDPDVAYDASRVLFAWKKALDQDDYHLYELDLATRQIRSLTRGLGWTDYEGVYLPDGHLLFNSTRCVQTVDCWWTEVSNLFTCDGDGRYLRRLSYDQVHTNFPTVTPDGRVLYTRWDYSDRGQIFPQGLFQMNPDGTGQAEFYGNNSWFPTTILHARAIPGTQQVLAIFTGHHTGQSGWLGRLDPTRGRQENHGAQLIAPIRPTPAERIDAYGQTGDQFQYPYPLSDTEFLVGFKPAGSTQPFAIYWMDEDGRRELLVADPDISCNQPIPCVPRARPFVRPRLVDYRHSTAAFYLHDIYSGPALAGVARGTIPRLRVVALDFRAAGIGENYSAGEAGEALSSTPVAIGNGAWDPKRVLGEATVYADGSALFTVPARTPVYFQALDGRGRMVQTMRSWSTLQPGETRSCIGCHEHTNFAPPSTGSLALAAGPEQLTGSARGFSYPRDVQPILDRHCTVCHYQAVRLDGQDLERARSDNTRSQGHASFSLRGDPVLDTVAKRYWSESYLVLTGSRRAVTAGGPPTFTGQPNAWVNWISVQSRPTLLPPGFAGSATSRLIALLEAPHYDVALSAEELGTIACWIDLAVPFCGDYEESQAWEPDEVARYRHFLQKRRSWESLERAHIEGLLAFPAP